MRVFVYVVLKNKFKDKWGETALQTTDEEQSTIASTAAKRLAQAKGFGYLGYEISSPLMYLNSGELTRPMTSDKYWELFKPFFRGKRDIIRTKLDEIGTVRNALAHFRPLKYDDIELIKQNVKHVFVGIALLGNSGPGKHRTFSVSNLISPAIITCFPGLARYCTFVFESIFHPQVTTSNTPDFKKNISLVFTRAALKEYCKEISSQMKDLISKVETETELVLEDNEDNLARGEIIDSVFIWSMLREVPNGYELWNVETESLKCGFGEQDPPEYWGEVPLYSTDFIAGSNKYPWMPSDISKDDEIPF